MQRGSTDATAQDEARRELQRSMSRFNKKVKSLASPSPSPPAPAPAPAPGTAPSPAPVPSGFPRLAPVVTGQKATAMSSNANEAILLPNASVGLVTNWGENLVMNDVQVRIITHEL
jgi:hypothetical protein